MGVLGEGEGVLGEGEGVLEEGERVLEEGDGVLLKSGVVWDVDCVELKEVVFSRNCQSVTHDTLDGSDMVLTV